MFKSIKVIKRYYKLANVKPILIFLEFLFLLIPAMVSIYSAVLAANVISLITVYDFSGAIKELSINFALIIVSAIFYFSYHLISKKVNHTISSNLNNFVYFNVRQNQNVSKISLSTLTDISKCIDFNKNLLYKICFFIKSIIIIFIVLYYSPLIGLGLVLVSLIMGLLLKFTDSKIQNHEKDYSKYQSNSLALFNSIQKGSKLEENQALETRLKDKYFKMVDNGAKIKNKIAFFYNLNNNFISLILKSAVFGFTIYLILLVKSTTLTLSLYLILTPYLTSSAQNLIEFFGLFSEIGIIDNTIDQFDALKFREEKEPSKENNEFELDNFNLYFYHTTFEANNSKQIEQKNQKNNVKNNTSLLKISSNIKDMNLKIEFGSSVAFVGEVGSGIQAIYKLLQYEENCTSGSIFLDYKNIAEIPSITYKSIVACTSTNTYFYNISILENLLLVCENKQKINSAIKEFGLKTEIEHLKDKLNTIVDENFNQKLLYYLGILRSYVSGAKIICIYDNPNNLNRLETQKLLHIIKFLKGKCSTLCFCHSDIFSSVVDKTYYVENSEIKNK